MATKTLVTVGSDNNVDWVQTPDGQKFTLGPVSVSKFLAALSDRPLRRSLDSFLMYGETVVAVDLDRMWEFLMPRRVRYAVGPFMAPVVTEARKNSMHELQAFEASLLQAEKALSTLTQRVASGQMKEVPALRSGFVTATQKIKSPNQSTNSTYYNLGQPDVYTVGDKPPPVEEAPTAKAAASKLAYDILQENSTIAGEILASLEETEQKIDSLVTAGKKFNATKAKMDLHSISTKVAGILRDADLTQTWVRGDLDKLASSADRIHGVFFPKK